MLIKYLISGSETAENLLSENMVRNCLNLLASLSLLCQVKYTYHPEMR